MPVPTPKAIPLEAVGALVYLQGPTVLEFIPLAHWTFTPRH